LSFSESTDTKEMRVVDFGEGRRVGCHALRIDVERRLAQWRISFDQLALHLREKQVPRSPLTPWLEVIVENAPPGEPIFQIVQDLARDRPFEVIRVLNQRPLGSPLLQLPEAAGQADAASLLESPERVFECRLASEGTLSEEDPAALETAFRELLDLHYDRSRAAEGDELTVV